MNPEPVTGDLQEAQKAYFTKQAILSNLASCYDPVGAVSPVTGQIKRHYHEIVLLNTDWDDPLQEQHLAAPATIKYWCEFFCEHSNEFSVRLYNI